MNFDYSEDCANEKWEVDINTLSHYLVPKEITITFEVVFTDKSTLTEFQQDLKLENAGQVLAVPVQLSGDLEQLPPIHKGCQQCSLQLNYKDLDPLMDAGGGNTYQTRAGLHHQEEDLIEAEHCRTLITLLKAGDSGGAGQGAPLHIIHNLCRIQASVIYLKTVNFLLFYHEEWHNVMGENNNVLCTFPIHNDDPNTIAVMISIDKATDIPLKLGVFGLAWVVLCERDGRKVCIQRRL